MDHIQKKALESPSRVAATGYQAARFQKKLNELSRAGIQVARQFLVLLNTVISNRSLTDVWWIADRLLMDFNGKVVKFEWPTFLYNYTHPSLRRFWALILRSVARWGAL